MESQKNMNVFNRMKRYHELFLQEYEEVQITKQAMANRDMKAMAASAAKGKRAVQGAKAASQEIPGMADESVDAELQAHDQAVWNWLPAPVSVQTEGMDDRGDIRAARGRKILEEMNRAKQKGKPAPKEEGSSKGAGS